MMLRYSFEREDMADAVEHAVRAVLADGYRTADIAQTRQPDASGTRAMGDAVVDALARGR